MKTAIIATTALFVVLVLCTVLAMRAANRPGDDFGAGVFAWVLAAMSLLALVVDVGLALIYAFTS